MARGGQQGELGINAPGPTFSAALQREGAGACMHSQDDTGLWYKRVEMGQRGMNDTVNQAKPNCASGR